MKYFNTVLFSFLICFISACDDEETQAHSVLYDIENDGEGVLINFVDQSRPDVLSKPGFTFTNRGDFQASFQHENGFYSGNYVVLPDQGVCVADENGDGLPDLLIRKKSKDRWRIAWDASGEKPEVSISMEVLE